MTTTRTWEPEWEAKLAGDACPFCAQGRPEENEHGIRIASTTTSDAYLQKSVYQPGYALVVWRGRHVTEPFQLSSDESRAYWSDVERVARALSLHFQPSKVNYQTLGNAEPHLHTHIQARYLWDPRPGKPLHGLPKYALDEGDMRRDVDALRLMLDTP